MSGRARLMLAAVAVLLLAATFPLRLALGLAGVDATGLSARGVTGTIWSGRLTDAAWRGAALGTIDAGLAPLSLLRGDVRLNVQRDDALRGPLTGALLLSGGKGAADLTGNLSLGASLAGVPLDSIRLDGVTARFDRSGRCVEAGGKMTLALALPVPGLDLAGGLTGPVACRAERAEARLASQSGMETLTLAMDGKGQWRARLAVAAGSDPALGALLRAAGFLPMGDALVLARDGRW